MLKGKRILIGVTGGIAAYKIPFLVREFKQAGAEVKCILTPASSAFVTPLTLATLSENPVETELFDQVTGEWANHVELGLWADALVIAPLTASSLAKMAIGHSDNLLLATYLSARCPVFVAPAMDLDMYAHPTTTTNLKVLESHGVHVIPAAHGELASGLQGQGRMAEPQDIARVVTDFFQLNTSQPLKGQKILITAGPTYEAIDPVRFIGNHSTGKMGIALADEAAALGAEVKLVLGPSALRPKKSSVEVVSVQSASEMWDAVKQQWEQCTAGIFAAAVADYRPEQVQSEKIKKKGETLELTLVKNPDILQWAGAQKKSGQLLTGFALETTNEEVHALEKLEKKNLDFIVLNSLNDPGAGFGHDTNRVSLIDKHNNIRKFELLSKTETAREIIKHIFAIA
jgi:phosphopantothenoylcysteine decarboxylase / phosphopantothenate---cysteine ligase